RISAMQSGQSAVDALTVLTSGRTGYRTDSNASAMSVEQMAFVGSPLPNAIIRRRHRVGTGGVGTRYRAKSNRFFKSYLCPMRSPAKLMTLAVSSGERLMGRQMRQ